MDSGTSKKEWSLEAAREMLADVRERTARAVAALDALNDERSELAPGSPRLQELEAGIEEQVRRWVREMEALGAIVKGLWLVDFDCGAGYYCWRWPEEGLDYFHTYEDGFEGRTRIQ